jgi:hypothetical protein
MLANQILQKEKVRFWQSFVESKKTRQAGQEPDGN